MNINPGYHLVRIDELKVGDVISYPTHDSEIIHLDLRGPTMGVRTKHGPFGSEGLLCFHKVYIKNTYD